MSLGPGPGMCPPKDLPEPSVVCFQDAMDDRNFPEILYVTISPVVQAVLDHPADLYQPIYTWDTLGYLATYFAMIAIEREIL